MWQAKAAFGRLGTSGVRVTVDDRHALAAAEATQGFGGPSEMWNAIVTDFSNIGEPAALTAFLQVLMIDLVLAGDNAIVVGALAAGLPADQRRKVILIGVSPRWCCGSASR